MITTIGAYLLQTYTPTLLLLLPPISGPAAQAAITVSSMIEAQIAILRLVAIGA